MYTLDLFKIVVSSEIIFLDIQRYEIATDFKLKSKTLNKKLT